MSEIIHWTDDARSQVSRGVRFDWPEHWEIKRVIVARAYPTYHLVGMTEEETRVLWSARIDTCTTRESATVNKINQLAKLWREYEDHELRDG